MNIRVIIKADVHPTEDLVKVEQACTNLFPGLEYGKHIEGDYQYLLTEFRGKTGLTHFLQRLREERIIPAARKILRAARRSNSISFCLNKQVAYVNRISFCEAYGESPLGPIHVEIICDKPEEVIDWLTPKNARNR